MMFIDNPDERDMRDLQGRAEPVDRSHRSAIERDLGAWPQGGIGGTDPVMIGIEKGLQHRIGKGVTGLSHGLTLRHPDITPKDRVNPQIFRIDIPVPRNLPHSRSFRPSGPYWWEPEESNLIRRC